MIADHLIEAAGHIKAKLEQLVESHRLHLVTLDKVEHERWKLERKIASLAKRIAQHNAALDTLANQPGRVSILAQILALLRAAPMIPPAPEVDLVAPEEPDAVTYARIVPDAEDRGPSPRTIALRKRDVPS